MFSIFGKNTAGGVNDVQDDFSDASITDAGSFDTTTASSSGPDHAAAALVTFPANGIQDDFSGDGISDILWYNTSTTQVGEFQENGNGTGSWVSLGFGAPNWSIVGTGDF